MSLERLRASLSDRYTIERELGQGGMATVYLAQDLKHDRQVALKVLKPELAAVLGAERFLVEIKTTAALQHPHILPLFDSGVLPDEHGQPKGCPYYVMPFIDGETLRAKLDRETQLGIEEAVRIASDVASALHYAHQHGVIHRDIKPENILLHDGRPMVADFGIALAVSAAAGGRMTETGLSLGTPHYMSPEQATAEKEITARSDVYSLGSVLYEMLTGAPPHVGASAQQIIMKIVTEEAAAVTRLRKSVPPNVAAAVAKALEKLPADRFDSAKAFAEALGSAAYRTTTLGGKAGSADRPTRHQALVWGFAGLSAILAAATGWLLLKRAPSAADDATPWVVDLGLPDSAGFSEGMSLSPDGSLLLYGGGMPRRRIWMRQAGTVDPTPILGTDGGCCPALSPDGQRVAFARNAEVHVIPLNGGTSTRIGSGFSPGDDLAWTTDGYVIGTPVGGGGLLRVPANSGAVTTFTVADSAAGEGAHWSPRALPEGRGVLFSIVPQDDADTLGLRIGVVGPEGGPHSVLLQGRVAAYAPSGHLLVVRLDGTLVAAPFDLKSLRVTGAPVPVMSGFGATGITTWLGYFAVAGSGRLVYVGGREPARELVWVRRSDGGVEVDNGGSGHWNEGVRLSADGRWLAVPYVVTGNIDLGGMEIRNRQTGASSRLEEQVGSVEMPSFSPDGRTLVYRRARPAGGGGDIFRVELGRTGEESLVLPDARASFPALSPDGRTLYFRRSGAQGVDFVAKPLDDAAGEGRVLLSGLPDWTIPSLSPNGQWVAFAMLAGGVPQVHVRSTDPARTERWQVAAPGGAGGGAGLIRWAPSGRELFFVAGDSVVAAQVSGGAEFTAGRTEALFSLRGLSGAFDIGPDGRFVFTRRQSGPSGFRMMMLDDWRALMRSP